MRICVWAREPEAVALFPILDLAAAVYHSMSTFDDIHVEQYEELK